MAKGTVLVVDDDPLIAEALEMALEGAGYRVLATMGAHALHVARTLHPDVILLDIRMPGMDGVELSRHLRADAATAAIPIVVMSAEDYLRATASLMPVNDRLPKPFSTQALFATIARWMPAA